MLILMNGHCGIVSALISASHQMQTHKDTMFIQRFYVNGQLQFTSPAQLLDKLRADLDTLQAHWGPRASRVVRPTIDELLVVDTTGIERRWINETLSPARRATDNTPKHGGEA